MFKIVSGMPLGLKFMNICSRREFGPKKIRKTPISDNRVDSTQKSNIDIDFFFFFSIEKSTEQIQFQSSISQSQVYYKICRNRLVNVIAILDESSSFLFGHVTN